MWPTPRVDVGVRTVVPGEASELMPVRKGSVRREVLAIDVMRAGFETYDRYETYVWLHFTLQQRP